MKSASKPIYPHYVSLILQKSSLCLITVHFLPLRCWITFYSISRSFDFLLIISLSLFWRYADEIQLWKKTLHVQILFWGSAEKQNPSTRPRHTTFLPILLSHTSIIIISFYFDFDDFDRWHNAASHLSTVTSSKLQNACKSGKKSTKKLGKMEHGIIEFLYTVLLFCLQV